MNLFIAIDDTDNKESIGTGRLSRMLAEKLASKKMIGKSRVTRHQLLVHPDIPYTSHNSSACIDTVIGDCSIDEIASCATAFLNENFHEGANPGLCIAYQDSVPAVLKPFGLRAQNEVIPLDEAKKLARSLDIFTWWNGETGQGCIGAMSAIGLRSNGNDGRYIELEGIRDIGGMLSAGEILKLTGIDRIVTLDGKDLAEKEIVDTQNWIRPTIQDGLVTLEVIPVNSHWRAPHEKKAKKGK